MSMQMAKRVSLSQTWGLNRSPHEIEPLYPFTGHNKGRSDASVRSTGRRTAASGRPMLATCHQLQTTIVRFQRSSDDQTCQLESDRILDLSVRSFPVRFQTRHFTTGRVRSCPTGLTQRPVTQRLLCTLHISVRQH